MLSRPPMIYFWGIVEMNEAGAVAGAGADAGAVR
jgi:hypothetical protein